MKLMWLSLICVYLGLLANVSTKAAVFEGGQVIEKLYSGADRRGKGGGIFEARGKGPEGDSSPRK